MRVVSYNILDGGVGRADPIGEVIEAQRPDAVVLVEANDEWVVRRLAKRMAMDYVIGHARSTIAVLSRRPIVHSVNRAAADASGPRAWLDVRLSTPADTTVDLIAVHLQAGASPTDEATRVAQLTEVLITTAGRRAATVPHVLIGDFNASAPAQRVDPIRCKRTARQSIVDHGDLPRDAIGLLLDHAYVDTLAAIRGDAAFDQVTFTTHHPGQRVDYAFAFGVTSRDAWIETDRLATYASDHYPVGVDLI